ncbi:MAG: FecR domain-containing protein [Calditrichaeota bacterium]|nr:FecR domain-containing protein [Calditrichota bacterium]MCB9474623.1 FecR domain-containing protein [Candidatus Delongbacteria bacterium]
MPVKLLLAGFSMLLLAASTLHSEGPGQVRGRVVFLEGDLSLRNAETTRSAWQPAGLDSSFSQGDLLRTGRSSRAELTIQQQSRIRLAPETQLEVQRLIGEGEDDLAEARLHLDEGEIWAEVNGLDEGEDLFEISSDLAGAAITGTAFSLSSRQGGAEPETRLRVWHGEVRISNAPWKMDQLEATEVGKAGPRKAPSSVKGPQSVAGPKSVSLDEWLLIVKDMQEVVIGAGGQVVSQGSFNDTETDPWMKGASLPSDK